MSVTEDAIAHRGTAREPWSACSGTAEEGAAEEEGAPRRLPERAANTLDRYSLGLQIVQVFPIVAEAVVVVVSTAWIARAISGVLLVTGTAWVVRRERGRELRSLRERSADREIPSGAGDPGTGLPALPDEAGGLLREMYRVVGARGGEIVISIRLRPAPPAPDRARRRPPRRSRTRPGR
ncbi:MAG TPA: hypothetical protein VFU73_06370 [Actinocrinis sp.]|nr:hypothetical protein [Actinocrinis sp.]